MSANFTPTMKGYNDPSAFRFWCQKVLPLVYDDSLSYYELLCKVVDYINNLIKDNKTTIDNIEALSTAYGQLQDYVNNYFDSLDVQTEINNKLDEMAVSGELGDIFERYLTPLIDQQNYRIDLLEQETLNETSLLGSRIDAQNVEIANVRNSIGSPLVASTVSQMTDTDRIYVYVGSETGYVSGNWYYWNGSAWVNGGVYNSGAIETDKTLTISGDAADAEVVGNDIKVLYNGEKGAYTSITPVFTLNKTTSGSTGEIVNVTDDIRAVTEDMMKCQDAVILTTRNGCQASLALYDTSKAFLGDSDWISGTAVVVNTKNAGYFRVIVRDQNNDSIASIYENIITSLSTKGDIKENINDIKNTNVFSGKKYKVNAEELTGVIEITGTVNSGNVGARLEIDVKGGEKYIINGYVYASVYPCIIFRNNTILDSYIAGTATIPGYVTNYEVTVPVNATKMWVNGKPGEILVYRKVSDLESNIKELDIAKQDKEIDLDHDIINIKEISEQSGAITPAGSVNPSVGTHAELEVNSGEVYLISGYVYVLDTYPLIMMYNDSTLVGYVNGRSDAGGVNRYRITIPENVTKIVINGRPYNIVVEQVENTVIGLFNVLLGKSKYNNKKIVWFGMSIPAGGFLGIEHPNSYPYQVGRLLGATVINESVGSSCMHCKDPARITASNPYGFNTNFEASSRCLTNSDEEMDWICENWDSSIWTENAPEEMTEWLNNTIHSFGYEELVDKYLTEQTMPDLFVFDHGFNDPSDTNNYYATYGKYSLYTYRGAMNFIIKRILDYNPYANIVIIGNYTTTRDLPEVQTAIAKDWALPIAKQWEYLGLSLTETVTATGYWDANNAWVEDGIERTYNTRDRLVPDKIHPFTNPTGKVDEKIAWLLAKFFDENVIV